MEKVINKKNKTERIIFKQNTILIFGKLLTTIFIVFTFLFFINPITEFLLMCENYLKLNILNYFFR